MIELLFEKVDHYSQMQSLTKIETLIIANIFIWMTPFVSDWEMMKQISNYALIKFATCEASIWEILFYLIWKVMFAWYWIERTPSEVIEIKGPKIDFGFKNDGTWFLPKNFKHKGKFVHFDHLYQGWFCPPKTAKIGDTSVPFEKC